MSDIATLPATLLPYWNMGAAWTALFDWTAIAAIATGAAAGVALWISGREERRLRRLAKDADVKTLKALLIVLANGHESTLKIYHTARQPENVLRGPGVFASGLQEQGISEVTDCLTAFSVGAMPSTSAIDLLMAARVAWQNILRHMRFASSISVAASERMYPDLAVPAWVEQVHTGPWERTSAILDRIADEILKQGGYASPDEDIFVQQRLSAAMKRVNG